MLDLQYCIVNFLRTDYCVGRRAFAVHGPMVWNSLPDDLRAQQDYESFRQGSHKPFIGFWQPRKAGLN